MKKRLTNISTASDSTLKSKKIQKTPLQAFQKTIRDFEFDMEFDPDSLQWSISGLLKGDLFLGKKREALVDLQNRPTGLKEMADVLNMDLASLIHGSGVHHRYL